MTGREATSHVEKSLREDGEVKDSSENIVEFPFGLPGFESLRRFIVVREKNSYPFHFLKSLETPTVSMLILDAQLLRVEDQIRIPAGDLEKVGIRDAREMAVFVILRLDKESQEFTANTKAPLVINTRDGIGRQVILEDRGLTVSYPLSAPRGAPAETM